MQHESKKIALIINELVTMLLLRSNGNIEVKVNRNDLYTEVTISQHFCQYDEMFIENLRYNLNTQRQTEVEGYYWQLVGNDDNGDELPLVGAMVDEAAVEYNNNSLYINIKRNNWKK